MAKLFDTADAERLIQEHRMMLEELDEIAQYEDNVQIDIEKAANLVVTRNVLDVLRDIPVEEINREKGGFRVKALRDHGFRSIADIVAANVYSISSVHGMNFWILIEMETMVKESGNKGQYLKTQSGSTE